MYCIQLSEHDRDSHPASPKRGGLEVAERGPLVGGIDDELKDQILNDLFVPCIHASRGVCATIQATAGNALSANT